MASVTTYLLVTEVKELDDVKSSPVIEESSFEVHDVTEETDEDVPRITFFAESSLEDQGDLSGAARTLSKSFPSSLVVISRVEERFDHIERLNTQVYIDGKRAGEIEHGYVLNVGS